MADTTSRTAYEFLSGTIKKKCKCQQRTRDCALFVFVCVRVFVRVCAPYPPAPITAFLSRTDGPRTRSGL